VIVVYSLGLLQLVLEAKDGSKEIEEAQSGMKSSGVMV
jgi:hypothetical protein